MLLPSLLGAKMSDEADLPMRNERTRQGEVVNLSIDCRFEHSHKDFSKLFIFYEDIFGRAERAFVCSLNC